MVKIGLKQEEEEEGVVTKVLLDNRAIRLVISEKFARRHKFRRTKLEKLVYVRNVDSILNYAGPICYDLKLKGLSDKTTLVLSNTRELNRDLFTK